MSKTSEILYALLKYVQSLPIEDAGDTFPNIKFVTQKHIEQHNYYFYGNVGGAEAWQPNRICIGTFSCDTYVESIIVRSTDIFKILADKASKEKSPIMYPLKHFIYGGAEKNNAWNHIERFMRQLAEDYRSFIHSAVKENYNSIDRVLKFDEKLIKYPCHAEIIRNIFGKDELITVDYLTMHSWT
jgi:hypothetical protein